MNNVRIEMKDVSYRYPCAGSGGVEGVNLSIKPGEVVCIAGGSGSGKTTLTRLVNGLIPHYFEGSVTGAVEVCGTDPSRCELWELAPNVGSVFQNPKTQFFCLDTTGELAFACENLGIPAGEINSRIKRVSESLDLDHLLDRSCSALSGGEKQRVACGSAAVLDPPVITLDEPSSNLDYTSIARLRTIVAQWKACGKTVLVSEHRLHWLAGIADHIVVMKEGRIAAVIPGEKFFATSADEARLLGLRAPSFSAIAEAAPPEAPKVTEGEEAPPPRRSAQPPIAFENVRYRYPRSARGIDVSHIAFDRGGVTALIGSNGAGKSTLARCLCGLVRGCAGTFDDGTGRRVLSSKAKRGYLVMQDVSHQLFRETVLDEVLEAMGHAGRRSRQNRDDSSPHVSRARAILASLDLTDVEKRHPLSLSGGQMQRVALASALASDRALLVLDEPTSGLDLAHMEQVAASVRTAATRGRAVVVVTHDPEFIRACCTDYVRMENGAVVDAGALDAHGWRRVTAFFESAMAGEDEHKSTNANGTNTGGGAREDVALLANAGTSPCSR